MSCKIGFSSSDITPSATTSKRFSFDSCTFLSEARALTAILSKLSVSTSGTSCPKGQLYFSFTGEPDVKNDQQQIVVVNPATESEETTSEQTVSAETEDTTATLQSAGSSLSGSMDWDAEDAYMLAKIAMAEAESEDTEGKALVILVVLNRVWSEEFPDTIAGVVFQDGQFSPISNGRYDEVEPDADCYRALQLVQIDGWDESHGATYFESKSESNWHSEHLTFLFKHGKHYFYKE